jgi:hypothetical protein
LSENDCHRRRDVAATTFEEASFSNNMVSIEDTASGRNSSDSIAFNLSIAVVRAKTAATVAEMSPPQGFGRNLDLATTCSIFEISLLSENEHTEKGPSYKYSSHERK